MSAQSFYVFLILVVGVSNAQEGSTSGAASTATSHESATPPGGGYDSPPPPGGGYDLPPPPGGGPLHGGFPGFPGLGFHKNFDFSAGAGFGPFGGLPLGGLPLGGLPLGGLPIGGLAGLLGGGVPPPDGGIPPPEAGLGGGFPGGFGGFTPSYIPSTWIGSALGAKGDLLFPIVIFVFFVVGVWTVVQLLLAFIVPLIAKKLAIKGGLLSSPFVKRDSPTNAITQQSDLDFITTAVLDAINEPKCLKYVACHSGNFLNGMAGGSAGGKNSTVKDYEGVVKSLSSMVRSESLDLFEEAFVNGNADCSKFTCERATHDHPVAGDAPK